MVQRNFSISATRKRCSAQVLAEAPAALWILFVGIGFPLLILATLTLRLGLFWEAVKEAAQVSCQAQTFLTPPTYPTSALSAVQSATTTAQNVLNIFPGCTLTQPVNVYIGATPISGGSTNWLNAGSPNQTVSAGQIDTDQNVYSIRVDLVGQVQPLVTFNCPYFGNIPGLTEPFPASVSEQRIFENPLGLSQ